MRKASIIGLGIALAATIAWLLAPSSWINSVLADWRGSYAGDTSGWQKSYLEQNQERSLILTSPVFTVNQLFPSMTGPASVHYFNLEPVGGNLAWIRGYQTVVRDAALTDTLSSDYLCHNNLDYGVVDYFAKWNLDHRAKEVNPRLFTLTQGQLACQFPPGFGLPVYTNDNLSLATQALNLNEPQANRTVRHQTRLDYVLQEDMDQPLVPLYQQSVFVMQPQHTRDSSGKEGDCRPALSSAARATLTDAQGIAWTGHWPIVPGRDTVRYNVTYQLRLPFNTTLHQAAIHIHPYAQRLILLDKTEGKPVLTADIENFEEKKGLKHIPLISSQEGIPFYQDHEYELVCHLHNPDTDTADMMAVMLLYFRDLELEAKIKAL